MTGHVVYMTSFTCNGCMIFKNTIRKGLICEYMKCRFYGWGIATIDIHEIIESIRSGRLRITNHAFEEAISDDLFFDGIFYSVLTGEIIEQYLEDLPYPSVLVNGRDFSLNDLHTVWAYNKVNKYSVLITVYKPDPARWVDGLRRRL